MCTLHGQPSGPPGFCAPTALTSVRHGLAAVGRPALGKSTRRSRRESGRQLAHILCDMAAADNVRAQIARLRRRSAEARRRAVHAEAAADRYEEQARLAPAFSHACLQLAALQRRVQTRHAISASLQDQYADRLSGWLGRRSRDRERPAFMDAVAAVIGMPSATITLFGVRGDEAMTAASDPVARAAHDLEFVLGEGPAHSVVADGREIEVAGTALCDRWPQYGPEVGRLGVQAVIAVPLRPPPARVGAICAYHSLPSISKEAATAIGAVADALPLTLSQATRDRPAGDFVLVRSLSGGADFPAAIHQAAGVVSQQCRCSVDNALALLRARAFAAGRPAEEVAADVLRGVLRLD